MQIFVSYSFKPENDWVTRYVIPLISCFGHEPRTGRILEGAQSVPDEVRNIISRCKRVICFATRAGRARTANGITMYPPPRWVLDENMMAFGRRQSVAMFIERDVDYGGAGAFLAWHQFSRDALPDLLIHLAELLKEWPVGPLQLRLNIPSEVKAEFDRIILQPGLKARCRAIDTDGNVILEEENQIRPVQDYFVIPFWIKTDPNIVIDIEIQVGHRQLISRGLSPSVCKVPLQAV
jgi:hypothetical protein